MATTFRRSEETYIDDTPRCHEVRAENARKVAEDNTGPTSFSLGQKKCETCEAMWSNLNESCHVAFSYFPILQVAAEASPVPGGQDFLRNGFLPFIEPKWNKLRKREISIVF